MSMTQESNALRLADRFDRLAEMSLASYIDKEAAAELRRLYEVNQELLEALTEMLQYSGLIEERCDCVVTNKARAAIAKAEGMNKATGK